MNRKIIYILLVISFILFLILSLVFNHRSNNAIEIRTNSLNKFSSGVKNNNSYIYIDEISEAVNGYAIVFDDETPLVVYLNDKLVNKIKEYSFDYRTIKLIGNSIEITKDVINNVLYIYNKESKIGDEDYLTKDSFTDVFGTYYLNVETIEDDNSLYKTPSFLSSLFLDFSFLSLLVLGLKIMLDKKNNYSSI